MNEPKKSVTTFSFKKIFVSITLKNRVFCVLKVSGATGVLDIFGFQLLYGWNLLHYPRFTSFQLTYEMFDLHHFVYYFFSKVLYSQEFHPIPNIFPISNEIFSRLFPLFKRNIFGQRPTFQFFLNQPTVDFSINNK